MSKVLVSLRRPFGAYVATTVVLSIVSDGWSGKPSPLLHQLLLLVPALALCCALFFLLSGKSKQTSPHQVAVNQELLRQVALALFALEALSLLMIYAESRHFAKFGYSLSRAVVIYVPVLALAVLGYAIRRGNAIWLLLAVFFCYTVSVLVAIRYFPLNYLRSDMLPVIVWADTRWLHHLNPYDTMHIGLRTYDFPYLPGMLVAYLPFLAISFDPRAATLFYALSGSVLIFLAGCREHRRELAVAIGIFLLCPFLQYRHDLYLQPHWFTVIAAVVLMQRCRLLWAGIAWGCSMAIYQLSWVVFPFAVLYVIRRRGWSRAMLFLAASFGAAAAMVGPLLASATKRIAKNTVGQWSLLPHALADPINLSYWLTYVIRPDMLKWVQLIVLTAMFAYCIYQRRCDTLADALRWMSIALAVFIPLNVIVDGYFYLTLLVFLLLYTCAVSGWWAEPQPAPTI